jgi:hypothetical protein
MGYLLKLSVCLVICLLLCNSSVFGAGVTTVFFVPFEVETYAPITRATITSFAGEKWTISSKSETSRLISLLNQGEQGNFDENKVRCLVLSGDQTRFIDSKGVVVQEQARVSVRIDKAGFLKFRDSLRADQRQILRK